MRLAWSWSPTTSSSSALQEVEQQEAEGGDDIGNVFGQILQGDIWTKLRLNELTKAYLDDPAFVSLLSRLQQNPKELPMYIHLPKAPALGFPWLLTYCDLCDSYLQSDPRIANVFAVLLGISQKPPVRLTHCIVFYFIISY
jgi:hypothetical protein